VSEFTTQRESPVDTEQHNLAKLQMNSHLAKFHVSHKAVEGRLYKSDIHRKLKQLHFNVA